MTTSNLQAIIESVIDIVTADHTNIKLAPDFMPESPTVFPFLAVFSDDGVWEFGVPGEKRGLHNIVVEIHISRKDLPIDLEQVMSFSDSIPNSIMSDPTLGGTCSTFTELSYSIVPMNWGNVQTLGFRFIIRNVKHQSTIT